MIAYPSCSPSCTWPAVGQVGSISERTAAAVAGTSAAGRVVYQGSGPALPRGTTLGTQDPVG